MTLQEKYKFLNLGWNSKTRFGSWENGPQEKEGLNNINNGPSPLGIWAKWVGSIMPTFIQAPFWLVKLAPIRVVSQNGLKWI